MVFQMFCTKCKDFVTPTLDTEENHHQQITVATCSRCGEIIDKEVIEQEAAI